MWHWLYTAFTVYVLHPTKGAGGRWWSGPGSDIGEFSVVSGVALVLRHRNCHHKGCWSIHTHNHPNHGWPACKVHWHEVPDHIKAHTDDPS